MNKQLIYQRIEEIAPKLTALSDKIWEYAELSMQETKSAQAYIQILREEGFEVEAQVCGIPTAFLGRYGSGHPIIGILGEYDALSGLSQKPWKIDKDPLVPGGNGHGCGHNLLGAGSLGAAIAVKELLEQGALQGTVVFYGCPGEEGCAGKTFMARDGMFRDLDAAFCWHPGDTNEIMVSSSAACLQVEYTFTGIAAHAAGDPEHGRSALDAAELMNIGVQFLREHMPKTCSIHYSFLDGGGVSPNVVQPTATVLYMVRGENVRQARDLLNRVNLVAKGAAIMTETCFTSRQIDGTSDTVSNSVLEKLLYENLLEAPLPEYSESDMAFATAMKDRCGDPRVPSDVQNKDLRRQVSLRTDGGRRPINDFVIPYDPTPLKSPGSTDVGDVSWLTPTAQFTAVTWISGSPGHSWQNVSTGTHPIAHKGMLLAAKVLACATADLMEQPQLLAQAREEFRESTFQGYECPIGKEVTF